MNAPIDLQSFCALPTNFRVYMRSPFRVDPWVYATNGHYVIRVATTGEPKCVHHAAALSAAALFDKWAATEFVPMPTFPQAPSCDHCLGTGVVADDECAECFGRGFEKWHPTRVGDAEFELGYLNKMATLPGVQIATRGSYEPMTLRFDGGEALLMPMLLTRK